jgi:hypothetical protein
VRSIRRIDEEEPITSLDPRDTSKVRPGRPSKSEPYRAFIERGFRCARPSLGEEDDM